MYSFLYNQQTHTYHDIYGGIYINSAADFDKFWMNFYNTFRKSNASPLDCLEMDIEDYEAMRFERIYGAWRDVPFLGGPVGDESVKTLRSFRRIAEKKNKNGEEIFKLLQENNPREHGYYDDINSPKGDDYWKFQDNCFRIAKLIGKVKFYDYYIKNEADVADCYDELLDTYELEYHFFDAELQLIDHYLGDKRPKDKTPITADDLHFFDVHWMLHWLEYFRDEHDLDEYCRLQMLEGSDITPNWYRRVEKFRFTDKAIAMTGEPTKEYPAKDLLDQIEGWSKTYEYNLKLRESRGSISPDEFKEENKTLKKFRNQFSVMYYFYSEGK